ncbi:3-beta-hydroxysteroid-Delta(8) [Emericellopsis cladophorae]|uniref:3-beta-hydroxysteroid-Delta(8) n=1 Tax=Emericellopsis cladophorae TaxID=2686198 RepID=A0A9Q0BCX6_9HYPO|nr:3-beta-hydroxysteroid-Delta(8) [Emericellopsis cladophorae]KAI6780231.1 3-beta-hydroxysteroid-Delta(8) [Emericellopsis cladophorae]
MTVAPEIAMEAPHPYFPLGVPLPAYIANEFNGPQLVGVFAAGASVILGAAFLIINRVRPTLRKTEIFTALWFVLCGFIHFFFEGYFAYNYHQMPSRMDIFGQLWKEYALSDSRYLTQDSFVVTMEAVTALFWGPLSFLCAGFIVTSHPMRYPLQLIISLGQFYGDVLYYATCTFTAMVDKIHFCRPEDFYYWAYYVLCNAFWIVIPGMLMISSVKHTGRAFAQVQKAEKAKKGK